MKTVYLELFIVLTVLFSIGASAAPAEGIEKFREKTKIENPFDLRDPFKQPPTKNDNNNKANGYYSSGKGHYSNIKDVSFSSLGINSMKVLGVLIGKERRAMVSAEGSKDVIILKEGMKIGQDEAELKAILPGGIVLVEKIINVYGQEEYLETVIPISK